MDTLSQIDPIFEQSIEDLMNQDLWDIDDCRNYAYPWIEDDAGDYWPRDGEDIPFSWELSGDPDLGEDESDETENVNLDERYEPFDWFHEFTKEYDV